MASSSAKWEAFIANQRILYHVKIPICNTSKWILVMAYVVVTIFIFVYWVKTTSMHNTLCHSNVFNHHKSTKCIQLQYMAVSFSLSSERTKKKNQIQNKKECDTSHLGYFKANVCYDSISWNFFLSIRRMKSNRSSCTSSCLWYGRSNCSKLVRFNCLVCF